MHGREDWSRRSSPLPGRSYSAALDQRIGLAQLAVTSTRFAVAIHRERWIAGCCQDDFRLRHSAKDPRTCPRKAVGLAPGELSRDVGMAPGATDTSKNDERATKNTKDTKKKMLFLRLVSPEFFVSFVPFVVQFSWIFVLIAGCHAHGSLSSPKSALRGHVFRLEACVAERIGRGGGVRCRDIRIRQHLTSEWAWPGSLSRRHVLRWPFIETDGSQGAARTISGYDILPRIQGHAHAKPWAMAPGATDTSKMTKEPQRTRRTQRNKCSFSALCLLNSLCPSCPLWFNSPGFLF